MWIKENARKFKSNKWQNRESERQKIYTKYFIQNVVSNRVIWFGLYVHFCTGAYVCECVFKCKNIDRCALISVCQPIVP